MIKQCLCEGYDLSIRLRGKTYSESLVIELWVYIGILASGFQVSFSVMSGGLNDTSHMDWMIQDELCVYVNSLCNKRAFFLDCVVLQSAIGSCYLAVFLKFHHWQKATLHWVTGDARKWRTERPRSWYHNVCAPKPHFSLFRCAKKKKVMYTMRAYHWSKCCLWWQSCSLLLLGLVFLP